MLQLAIAILIAISFTGVGILISKYIIKLKITGSTSDGYHTFDELYYYRLLYNAALVNTIMYMRFKNGLDNGIDIPIIKSDRHSDGELCFGGGWFIVMMKTPYGQISNHYEMKYWDMFSCPSQYKSWEYDGHTPKEAAERLNKLNEYIIDKLNATSK